MYITESEQQMRTRNIAAIASVLALTFAAPAFAEGNNNHHNNNGNQFELGAAAAASTGTSTLDESQTGPSYECGCVNWAEAGSANGIYALGQAGASVSPNGVSTYAGGSQSSFGLTGAASQGNAGSYAGNLTNGLTDALALGSLAGRLGGGHD